MLGDALEPLAAAVNGVERPGPKFLNVSAKPRAPSPRLEKPEATEATKSSHVQAKVPKVPKPEPSFNTPSPSAKCSLAYSQDAEAQIQEPCSLAKRAHRQEPNSNTDRERSQRHEECWTVPKPSSKNSETESATERGETEQSSTQ